MSTADATQRLRGEAHTVVGVSVLRPSTGQTIDLTIPRAQIVR
jgi:C-terminal processing protease CtpA/Prc